MAKKKRRLRALKRTLPNGEVVRLILRPTKEEQAQFDRAMNNGPIGFTTGRTLPAAPAAEQTPPPPPPAEPE